MGRAVGEFKRATEDIKSTLDVTIEPETDWEPPDAKKALTQEGPKGQKSSGKREGTPSGERPSSKEEEA